MAATQQYLDQVSSDLALGARPQKDKPASITDKLGVVGMVADKLNPVNQVQTLAGAKVGNLIAPVQDVAANTVASGLGLERPNKTAIGEGAFAYDAANKSLFPDGTIPNAIKSGIQNTLGWKPATTPAPTLGATPSVASAVDGKYTNDATRQAETARFLANDAANALNPNKVNAVQDPSTPQKTAPVAAENVAVNTKSNPDPNGFGAKRLDYGVTAGQNVYDPASRNAVADSERFMNQTDGSIGAGIVSRGLANRAKTFADMSNANDASKATVQNSNTNSFTAESQAAERLKESARQDNANQVDVNAKQQDINGKQISNEAAGRINKLQSDYLAEASKPVGQRDNAKLSALNDQMTALTGKTTDKFTPVMGKDDLGNSTYLGAFDNRTGSYVPQSQQTQMGNVGKAPQAAVDMLKKDPSLADAFKTKYGYLPS